MFIHSAGLGTGDTNEATWTDDLVPVSTDNIGTNTIVTFQLEPLGKVVALLSNGSVVAWGDNTLNGLGVCQFPSTFINKPTVVPSLPKLKRIAVSRRVSYGCDENGSVWSWGAVSSTQAAVMTGRNIASSPQICDPAIPGPGIVDLGGSSCTDLSAGDLLVAVITNEPAVYIWGVGIGNTPFKLPFPYLFTPLKVAASDSILVYGVSDTGARELWTVSRFAESTQLDPVHRYRIGINNAYWFGRSAALDLFYDDFQFGDFQKTFSFANRIVTDVTTRDGQWVFLTDAHEAVAYISETSGFSNSGTNLEQKGFIISDAFAGKRFIVTKFNALLEDTGSSRVLWTNRESLVGGVFSERDWSPARTIQPLTDLPPSSAPWINVFKDDGDGSATVAALDGTQ